MSDANRTKEEVVKRYDCTSGGNQWCQGCYQMEVDEYGDYVRFEDYERLAAERDQYKQMAEINAQTAKDQAKYIREMERDRGDRRLG